MRNLTFCVSARDNVTETNI